MLRVNVTPTEYASALGKMARKHPKAAIKALRKTARYGHTKVVGAAKISGVRTTGKYEQGWRVVNIPKGAIIGNTTVHAIFVEVGRRPGGRLPPIDKIVEWLRRKKIVTGRGGKRMARKIAFPVARAIARRGTKGHYLMKKQIPDIRAHAAQEIFRAWAKLGSGK